MNVITVDKEEACNIACGDSERFEEIERYNNGSDGRWSVGVSVFVREIATNKYYQMDFQRPATENQGGLADCFVTWHSLTEVERKEVVRYDWVEV